MSDVLPLYEAPVISLRDHGFRNHEQTYEVEVMDSNSLADSLFLVKESIMNLFREILKGGRGFKYILSIRITFKKWNNEINAYQFDTIYHNSDPIEVTNQRFKINEAYELLKHRVEFFQNEGSGWIIDRIEDIWINITTYDPLAAGSYIELPSELNNSMKGLINIQNTDNKCFMWCQVRLLNPKKSHPERVTREADKEIGASLDYSDINFPLKARDHKLVEERFNINVNILAYDKKKKRKFITYIFQKKTNEQVLNVLLITKGDDSHYVFIKDIEKLLSSQIRTKTKGKKHICLHCIQNFTSEDVLKKHKTLCMKINGTQAAEYEERV